MNTLNRRRLAAVPTTLLTVSSLILAQVPAQAFADASPTPTTTSIDYNSVCGTPSNASVPATTNEQKAAYCAAAKQAQSAQNKDTILFGLYAAASAVCVASCVFEWAGGDAVCSGAVLATGIADVIETKQFTNSFGLMISAYGLYKSLNALSNASSTLKAFNAEGNPNAYSNSSSNAVAKSDGNSDSSSGKETCIMNAAMSGLEAMMHKMSANSDKGTYKSNLINAANLNSQAPASYNLTGASVGSTAAATSGGTSGGSSGYTSGGSSAQAGNDVCGSSNTSTVAGALSCAATAAPQLANMASTPEFQNALQKASGMSLGDYLGKSGGLSAGGAVGAGLGALGNTDTSPLDKGFADAEKEMQKSFDVDPSAGGVYAGHLGGGKSAGSSGEDPMAAMLKSLMGQIGGQKGEDKGKGVSEVNFGAGAKRDLASVRAEDPTVSLFDRVAYRYTRVVPRLLVDTSQRTLQGWSSPAAAPAAAQRSLQPWGKPAGMSAVTRD